MIIKPGIQFISALKQSQVSQNKKRYSVKMFKEANKTLEPNMVYF